MKSNIIKLKIIQFLMSLIFIFSVDEILDAIESIPAKLSWDKEGMTIEHYALSLLGISEESLKKRQIDLIVARMSIIPSFRDWWMDRGMLGDYNRPIDVIDSYFSYLQENDIDGADVDQDIISLVQDMIVEL